MKRKIYAYIAGLGVLAAAGALSCADLGFGVDVDSGPANPYWYGNGYLGDTYWNTPVWNYGPIYRSYPPRPPFISAEPGPVIPPRPQQPSQPENTFPGINKVPTTVGGVERPGNGGLPTPSGGPSGNNALRR